MAGEITKTMPYHEGREAFLAGKGGEACPYPPAAGHSVNRIRWWNGWLDARTEQKYGK